MRSENPPEEIDPTRQVRWAELLESHPSTSVFHSVPWLRALRICYGYRPRAWCLNSSQTGSVGLAACEVRSRLTGARLVSMPFSDHCEPLVDTAEQLGVLLQGLLGEDGTGFRYVEIRPLHDHWSEVLETQGFQPSERFLFHEIDLRPGVEVLWKNLHAGSIRRKIRRAEREGLEVRQGNDPGLVNVYYRLHLRTRRRQGVPPQPLKWFRELAKEFGEKVRIYLAYYKDIPVAGIFTLQWGTCLTYKYGASDERRNPLGGNPLLMWSAMQDACAAGLERFDLGRCDWNNAGLAQYKERLGAARRRLMYYRRPSGSPHTGTSRLVASVCRRLPLPVLRLLGRLLYRHVG